jgi:hypothetical protein
VRNGTLDEVIVETITWTLFANGSVDHHAVGLRGTAHDGVHHLVGVRLRAETENGACPEILSGSCCLAKPPVVRGPSAPLGNLARQPSPDRDGSGGAPLLAAAHTRRGAATVTTISASLHHGAGEHLRLPGADLLGPPQTSPA